MCLKNKMFCGFYDKNQSPIHHGDIFRFYFDADYGHGDDNSGFTEMIDVCWFDENENRFMLVCDLGMGSFVYRHNKYCEVIGNVYENKEFLNSFSVSLLGKLFPEVDFTQK